MKYVYCVIITYFDAGGQPIQVFINLPLSEISDIDDQHSVSTELLKFYSVKVEFSYNVMQIYTTTRKRHCIATFM